MVYGTEDTVSAESVSACPGDGGVCERQSVDAVGDVQARTRNRQTCRHSISVVAGGERGTEDGSGAYKIRIRGVDVAVHRCRRQIPTPTMAFSLSSTVQLSSGPPIRPLTVIPLMLVHRLSHAPSRVRGLSEL